jgi:hypothetical protein
MKHGEFLDTTLTITTLTIKIGRQRSPITLSRRARGLTAGSDRRGGLSGDRRRVPRFLEDYK